MVHSEMKAEIERELERLPLDLQRQVLDFARALAATEPKGVPGRDLLRFAGTISNEDADAMLEVIEVDCERVDPDEW